MNNTYDPTRTDASLTLHWLGQAGFLFKMASQRVVIDPYLSDSLARKYAGTVYDHQRLVPPPIQPEQCTGVGLILCTHGHTDHMDPETLLGMADANPACLFVLPRYEADRAREIGLPEGRTILVNAGETFTPLPGFEVVVTPAAHETFEQNEQGEQRFLGYILKAQGHVLYHSGDTLVFDGLAELLSSHQVAVAMLPCNGRDATRKRNGVPGNMTLAEAASLCRAAAIPSLIPHHFGMFAFNTCLPEDLAGFKTSCHTPAVHIPRLGVPLPI